MTPQDEELERLASAATGYDGYSVDSDGNIWSTVPWRGTASRRLALSPNFHGYLTFKVKAVDVIKKVFVHKVVCRAFNGERPTPLHEVRHLDGNKANNAASNLAWGTRSENAHDRKRHGTERAAENGKKSSWKLAGRYKEICLRGHDKKGRSKCNTCHNLARAAQRSANKVGGHDDAR